MKIAEAIKTVEQPFLAQKPLAKVAYYNMMKQMQVFYSAYDFSDARKRANFVNQFYLYMRGLDDIVDGENSDFQDITQIREILQDQGGENDYLHSLQALFESSQNLAAGLGFSIDKENSQLLNSLEFDLTRRGDIAREAIILSPQAEINERFFTNFIDPTFGLMAKTINQCLTPELRSLGRASRIYYNLHDLFEDISHGLINVSHEDAAKFDLDEDSFLRLARDELLPQPDTIKRQKKLGVADTKIKKLMGEGLTAWTEQELKTGRAELKAYQDISRINSLSAAVTDLIIHHHFARDNLFFFQSLMGTNRFYSKNE